MKPDFKLPFWMDGPRATAMANTSKRYWELAENYVRLPLATFDVLTCAIGFVNLIAYQRGIDRFPGENEGFYRLRVHHAMRNAIAAGTPRGMNQIFNNLELPEAEYFERLPQYDWDTTEVVISGRRFVPLEREIKFALDYYWRTCRRYSIGLKTTAQTIYGPANIASGNTSRTATVKPNTLQARPASNTTGMANTAQGHAQRRATVAPQGIKARPLNSITGLINTAQTIGRRVATAAPQGFAARPINSLAGIANTLSVSVTKHRSFTL